MSHRILASFAALLPFVLASPTPAPTDNDTGPAYVHPANGNCVDYTVNTEVTFPSLTWALPKWKDDYDVAAFLYNMTSRDAQTGGFQPFDGTTTNVTKSWDISATFCSPKTQKGKESTILVATHGGGYDRRYWASSFQPENYNFAQAVLDEGYSIFYYDRLGLGKSSRIPGFEIQGLAQINVLKNLVDSIRSGSYTSNIKASKIVIVGHSFGSIISNGALALYPEIGDAAVLTGIAYPSDNDPAATFGSYVLSLFGSRIASQLPIESKPQFADTFDTGYTAFGDIFRHVQCFFHQPNYDVNAAKYAQSISQPNGASEVVSTLAVNLTAPEYKGKLLITSGQYDLLECQGNCTALYANGLQHQKFPKANITTYVHPEAGHGVNFGYNATGFYKEILGFVNSL